MAPKSIHTTTGHGAGFFNELSLRARLVIRLMGDRRVNLLLKALPVASLVYLVFPDFAFGPVDDAVVIWLGSYLFVELCPPQVVQEHMQALRRMVPGAPQDAPPADEIVDGEYRDVS